MGLVSTSLALLVSVSGQSQAPGRFARTEFPKPPGWILNETGLRAAAAASDELGFVKPLKLVRTKTDGSVAWYRGDTFANMPKAVKVNLRVPGIDLYFPMGLKLNVGSVQSPFVTTPEASFGPNLPAAPSRWALVTFDARQPPVLLIFQEDESLLVEGKPGQWRITTKRPFRGWIRFSLPQGLKASGGTSAAALGRAAKEVQTLIPDLSASDPGLVETKVIRQEGGCLVRWEYGRAGVVVPPPAYLAKYTSSGVRIKSRTERLPIDLDEGPLVLTREKTLEVWFPVRSLSVWRSLTIGPAPGSPESLSNPGIRDIAELSFAGLLANRSESLHAIGLELLDRHMSRATRTPDLPGGRLLPGSPNGGHLDTAAVYALLSASLSRTPGTGRLASPTAGLKDLVDWFSWRLRAEDPAVARRAGALLALALALSSSELDQALGAQLQAALDSEPVLEDYQRRLGFRVSAVRAPDPISPIRQWVFGSRAAEEARPWASALISPVRIRARGAVEAVKTQSGLDLRWAWLDGQREAVGVFSPRTLPDPVPMNLRWELTTETPMIGYRATPESIGPCSVTLPDSLDVKQVPLAPPRFLYSE
ncbi:MAG: hypothetical protein KF884_00305 [Fimbriimonadaceae bacterium]|nr:hypothetical protein [Fimbriimonadaceae bacterium]QYK58537.1 MAG: hypothetical protein KF884_00305 [Fimbriimonadaceae bacterium]